MVRNYVIIENTPGYLPENDEPPTFDSYAEALRYLVEYRHELAVEPCDDEGNLRWDVSPIVDGGFSYSQEGWNDLGRVVQIEPLAED